MLGFRGVPSPTFSTFFHENQPCHVGNISFPLDSMGYSLYIFEDFCWMIPSRVFVVVESGARGHFYGTQLGGIKQCIFLEGFRLYQCSFLVNIMIPIGCQGRTHLQPKISTYLHILEDPDIFFLCLSKISKAQVVFFFSKDLACNSQHKDYLRLFQHTFGTHPKQPVATGYN